METSSFILLMVLFAASGYILRKNEHRKENIVIWLYFLAGGLAVYSVETADIDQPLNLTAIKALLICLVPTLIDSFLSFNKPTLTLKRKNLITTSKN
jgi:biotin transporter BioY